MRERLPLGNEKVVWVVSDRASDLGRERRECAASDLDRRPEILVGDPLESLGDVLGRDRSTIRVAPVPSSNAGRVRARSG